MGKFKSTGHSDGVRTLSFQESLPAIEPGQQTIVELLRLGSMKFFTQSISVSGGITKWKTVFRKSKRVATHFLMPDLPCGSAAG